MQVTDLLPVTYRTTETYLPIEGFPLSGEFSLNITPVLSDLNLSGDPLESTVGRLLTQCKTGNFCDQKHLWIYNCNVFSVFFFLMDSQ